MTDELQRMAWDWIVQNETRLRSLVRRYASPRITEDELYSDVVLVRVPRIIVDLWDGVRPLWPYVKSNVCGYCFKYVGLKNRVSFIDIDSIDESLSQSFEDVDIDARLWVTDLARQISEYDFYLLWMRYVEDMTLDQIAKVLGCARGTAKNHCQAALYRARDTQGE